MSTTQNPTADQKLAAALARHRREVAALTAEVEAERKSAHDALTARLDRGAADAIQATIERTRAVIVGDRVRGELAVVATGVPSAIAAEMRAAAAEAEAQGRRRPAILVFTPRPDRFGHAPATAFALVDVSREVYGH